MKLFSKKAPREIKEDDSTLVKLWYNPRTHAIIVLGAYLVFFLIIILIANTSTNTKKVQNKKLGSDLESYFINLSDKNVSYNYTISKRDETYYFSGIKQTDGNIFGTMLHNNEINKILVSNESCVVGDYDNDNFIVSEDICPELDYDMFFYSNIYEKVKNLKSLNSVNKNKYSFKVTDKITYIIYIDNDMVNKVEVKNGVDSYTLNYNSAKETIDEIEK